MKHTQIIMLSIFSIGMGVGQLLLKLSAQRQTPNLELNWTFRLLSLLRDWAFLLGIVLYGLLLIYWVWLLTFTPLSRAYPFTLLSLFVVAIGSALLFEEPLTIRFVTGLFIIGAGLAVLSTE